MALRLILGRAGSGKTWFCLDSARRLALADPDGPPVFLLVPEQATHQTERALLSGPGAPGATMRVSVLSFRRLALRVLEETGGVSLPLLDVMGRQMLLAAIVQRRREELKVFRRSARRPGFVRRLANTMAELAAQKVGPANLETRREAMVAEAAGNQLLAGKLGDLAMLLRDYQSAVQDVYLDPHSAVDLASVRLAATPLLSGAEVFVDGFAGFTPQEFDLLGAVLSAAADVHVALCLDPAEVEEQGAARPSPDDPRLFTPTIKTYWSLLSLAAKHKVRVLPAVRLPRPGQPARFLAPTLKFLEATWDTAGNGAVPPAALGEIELSSAPDQRREAYAAAGAMQRLARERGYAWRDMAVIVPDLAVYHDLLRLACAEAGIPLFVDRRRPVPYHPLVEFLRSTVEIAADNWAPAPVARWLKTDLTGLTRLEADRLENCVLATGVRGKRWTQAEPWRFPVEPWTEPGTGDPLAVGVLGGTAAGGAANAPVEPEDLAAGCDELRRKVAGLLAGPVERLRAGMRTAQPVPEYVAALNDLLTAAGLPATLARWADEAIRAGDLDAAQEHREVWEGAVRVLEQMHAAFGGQPVVLDDFQAVLGAGLESLELGLVPPSLDQVVCGTVQRSRQPELKAAFVLGARLGAFPGAPTEDVVFNDAERLTLRDPVAGAGPLDLSAPAEELAFHEDYLTYIALTRASEHLYVSYPERAGTEDRLPPSPVFDHLRKLFPDLAIEPVDAVETAPTMEALSRETAGHLAGVKHGVPLPPRWAAIYDWLVGSPVRRQALRHAFAGLGWANHARRVSPGQAAALYGRPVRGSASRLEKFAQCPFAHYAQHGLRLAVRAERKAEAPETGTFYHAMLQRYFGELRRAGRSLAELDEEGLATSLAQLFAATEGQLERSVWGDSARLRYLARVLQRTISRTVRQLHLHSQRSEFRPLGLELGFGLPGTTRPALDLGQVLIRGVVDRLDYALAEGRLLLQVLDYKSGRKEFHLDLFAQGLELQLPIYMLAALGFVAALIEAVEPGARAARPEIAAACLFPVQDPVVTLADLDDEELAKKQAKHWLPSGLFLGEAKVVEMLDHATGQRDAPAILPVQVKKGGEVSGSGTAGRDQLAAVVAFAQAQATAIAARLAEGETSLAPYRSARVRACTYCDFHSLCGFDPQFAGNSFRDLVSLKPAEAWDRITAAVRGAGEVECR